MAVPSLKMNTGAEIPQVGFGLWQVLPGIVCKRAVRSAIEIGYTHFDDAQAYHNEQHLGSQLKESKLARKDVFITTKIQTKNLGRADVIPNFEKSLKKLQTDYVDLLLIHFPVTEHRREAWEELEKIYKSGRAKAIGVSNYMVSHLKEMEGYATVAPAVNQIELHVFLQMPDVVNYCKKQGIIVEAYSPLAHGHGIDDPVLASIAKKYVKTNAQIMLRWCIEIGTVPLPKSTHADRIKENFEIFDFKLDASDMAKLKKLDCNMRTCWDPTIIP